MEQIERGRYIIFEGGENVGKSTMVERTQNWLESQSIESVIIQEPYDDPIAGGLLKELLYSDDPERNFHSLDNWQQAMLFNTARRTIAKKVGQHLSEGKWALSSRSFLSTSVYQGRIQNIDVAMSGLRQLNTIGCGVKGGKPDMVFVLDADPSITTKRINPDKKVSILDAEKLEIHHKVRLGYLLEAESLEHQLPYIEVIDAELTEDKVFERVSRYIGIIASNYPPYKLREDTREERRIWLKERFMKAFEARDRDLGKLAISSLENREHTNG